MKRSTPQMRRWNGISPWLRHRPIQETPFPLGGVGPEPVIHTHFWARPGPMSCQFPDHNQMELRRRSALSRSRSIPGMTEGWTPSAVTLRATIVPKSRIFIRDISVRQKHTRPAFRTNPLDRAACVIPALGDMRSGEVCP